jgi:hypothetical protein
VTYSLMLSVVMAAVGVVMWIEGGPHPRTRAAWLLLGAILVVSVLPMLVCRRARPSCTSSGVGWVLRPS